MKGCRFTETQIVSVLEGADTRSKVKDTCRKHAISKITNYSWKSKY